MPQGDVVFQLNSATLAVLSGIVTALGGIIVFLGKQLLDSKDRQIKDLARDCQYWQSTALGLMQAAGKAVSVAERRRMRP